MDPMILSIVAFVAVAALIGAIAFVMRDFGTTATEDRLEVLTGRRAAEGESGAITKDELLREGMDGVSAFIGNIFARFGNLGLLFEQADSPIKPATFFGISAGMAVLGVVVTIVLHSPPPLYPIAFLGMGCLPLVWMLWRRKGRFKAFGKQLPDALELIGRALRSGHSLASGIFVVVEEMPAPVSTEFGMAYEAQNLGVPIETALKSMLKRMPNLDLKFFVTAVAIQRQSGGDLAEILDKIGHIIRERFKILGQVQALTGEGRISGIVLMVLPIALLLAVYHLNPTYIMILFTDPVGHQMIGGAAVLQVLGAISIKKIIDIKV